MYERLEGRQTLNQGKFPAFQGKSVAGQRKTRQLQALLQAPDMVERLLLMQRERPEAYCWTLREMVTVLGPQRVAQIQAQIQCLSLERASAQKNAVAQEAEGIKERVPVSSYRKPSEDQAESNKNDDKKSEKKAEKKAGNKALEQERSPQKAFGAEKRLAEKQKGNANSAALGSEHSQKSASAAEKRFEGRAKSGEAQGPSSAKGTSSAKETSGKSKSGHGQKVKLAMGLSGRSRSRATMRKQTPKAVGSGSFRDLKAYQSASLSSQLAARGSFSMLAEADWCERDGAMQDSCRAFRPSVCLEGLSTVDLMAEAARFESAIGSDPSAALAPSQAAIERAESGMATEALHLCHADRASLNERIPAYAQQLAEPQIEDPRPYLEVQSAWVDESKQQLVLLFEHECVGLESEQLELPNLSAQFEAFSLSPTIQAVALPSFCDLSGLAYFSEEDRQIFDKSPRNQALLANKQSLDQQAAKLEEEHSANFDAQLLACDQRLRELYQEANAKQAAYLEGYEGELSQSIAAQRAQFEEKIESARLEQTAKIAEKTEAIEAERLHCEEDMRREQRQVTEDPTWFERLGNWIDEKAQGIDAMIDKGFQFLAEKLESIAAQFSDFLEEQLGKLGTFLAATTESIKEMLLLALGSLKTCVQYLVKQLISQVQKLHKEIEEQAKHLEELMILAFESGKALLQSARVGYLLMRYDAKAEDEENEKIKAEILNICRDLGMDETLIEVLLKSPLSALEECGQSFVFGLSGGFRLFWENLAENGWKILENTWKTFMGKLAYPMPKGALDIGNCIKLILQCLELNTSAWDGLMSLAKEGDKDGESGGAIQELFNAWQNGGMAEAVSCFASNNNEILQELSGNLLGVFSWSALKDVLNVKLEGIGEGIFKMLNVVVKIWNLITGILEKANGIWQFVRDLASMALGLDSDGIALCVEDFICKAVPAILDIVLKFFGIDVQKSIKALLKRFAERVRPYIEKIAVAMFRDLTTAELRMPRGALQALWGNQASGKEDEDKAQSSGKRQSRLATALATGGQVLMDTQSTLEHLEQWRQLQAQRASGQISEATYAKAYKRHAEEYKALEKRLDSLSTRRKQVERGAEFGNWGGES